MRDIELIIKDINEFVPHNDEWGTLDELIEEALSTSDPQVVKPLLGLLERNPDEDSCGVFWSIVHGLEALENYETELAVSVLSKPHEMSVLMLNRMLNGGIEAIDGRSILEILEQVSLNSSFSDSIREEAVSYLAYQRNNK